MWINPQLFSEEDKNHKLIVQYFAIILEYMKSCGQTSISWKQLITKKKKKIIDLVITCQFLVTEFSAFYWPQGGNVLAALRNKLLSSFYLMLLLLLLYEALHFRKF